MSLQHHSAETTPPPPDRAADAEPSAKLAHELANLLDGGLRNVSLVLSSLRDADRDAGPSSEGLEDVVQRLDTASEALRQMGTLLRRWLTNSRGPLELGYDGGTLEQAVAHAVRLFTAAAEPAGIEVRGACDSALGSLAVGPVFPVIINAVRNSVEAHLADPGRPEGEPRRVDVSAKLDSGRVMIEINDNGPGIDPSLLDESSRFRFGSTTKPTGHGLGMTLAQQIAQSLGGELTVAGRSPRGASVRLSYPKAALSTKKS